MGRLITTSRTTDMNVKDYLRQFGVEEYHLEDYMSALQPEDLDAAAATATLGDATEFVIDDDPEAYLDALSMARHQHSAPPLLRTSFNGRVPSIVELFARQSTGAGEEAARRGPDDDTTEDEQGVTAAETWQRHRKDATAAAATAGKVPLRRSTMTNKSKRVSFSDTTEDSATDAGGGGSKARSGKAAPPKRKLRAKADGGGGKTQQQQKGGPDKVGPAAASQNGVVSGGCDPPVTSSSLERPGCYTLDRKPSNPNASRFRFPSFPDLKFRHKKENGGGGAGDDVIMAYDYDSNGGPRHITSLTESDDTSTPSPRLLKLGHSSGRGGGASAVKQQKLGDTALVLDVMASVHQQSTVERKALVTRSTQTQCTLDVLLLPSLASSLASSSADSSPMHTFRAPPPGTSGTADIGVQQSSSSSLVPPPPVPSSPCGAGAGGGGLKQPDLLVENVVENHRSEQDDPLLRAARDGDLASVTRLAAAYGPQLYRARNSAGGTALHIAVERGHLAAARHLAAAYPALVEVENRAKLTPAALAVKTGSVAALDWLLHHSAPVRDAVTRDPARRRVLVTTAAKHGQDSCLRLLLEAVSRAAARDAPMPDFADVNLNTPAHAAAKHGHIACLQTLVEFGVDVTRPNRYGYTPCYYADFGNHRYCAGYLVVIETALLFIGKLLDTSKTYVPDVNKSTDFSSASSIWERTRQSMQHVFEAGGGGGEDLAAAEAVVKEKYKAKAWAMLGPQLVSACQALVVCRTKVAHLTSPHTVEEDLHLLNKPITKDTALPDSTHDLDDTHSSSSPCSRQCDDLDITADSMVKPFGNGNIEGTIVSHDITQLHSPLAGFVQDKAVDTEIVFELSKDKRNSYKRTQDLELKPHDVCTDVCDIKDKQNIGRLQLHDLKLYRQGVNHKEDLNEGLDAETMTNEQLIADMSTKGFTNPSVESDRPSLIKYNASNVDVSGSTELKGENKILAVPDINCDQMCDSSKQTNAQNDEKTMPPQNENALATYNEITGNSVTNRPGPSTSCDDSDCVRLDENNDSKPETPPPPLPPRIRLKNPMPLASYPAVDMNAYSMQNYGYYGQQYVPTGNIYEQGRGMAHTHVNYPPPVAEPATSAAYTLQRGDVMLDIAETSFIGDSPKKEMPILTRSHSDQICAPRIPDLQTQLPDSPLPNEPMIPPELQMVDASQESDAAKSEIPVDDCVDDASMSHSKWVQDVLSVHRPVTGERFMSPLMNEIYEEKHVNAPVKSLRRSATLAALDRLGNEGEGEQLVTSTSMYAFTAQPVKKDSTSDTWANIEDAKADDSFLNDTTPIAGTSDVVKVVVQGAEAKLTEPQVYETDIDADLYIPDLQARLLATSQKKNISPTIQQHTQALLDHLARYNPPSAAAHRHGGQGGAFSTFGVGPKQSSPLQSSEDEGGRSQKFIDIENLASEIANLSLISSHNTPSPHGSGSSQEHSYYVDSPSSASTLPPGVDRQNYAATTELNAEILRHILDMHTRRPAAAWPEPVVAPPRTEEAPVGLLQTTAVAAEAAAQRSITPKLIRLSDAEFMETYARPASGVPAGVTATVRKNANSNNNAAAVPLTPSSIRSVSAATGAGVMHNLAQFRVNKPNGRADSSVAMMGGESGSSGRLCGSRRAGGEHRYCNSDTHALSGRKLSQSMESFSHGTHSRASVTARTSNTKPLKVGPVNGKDRCRKSSGSVSEAPSSNNRITHTKARSVSQSSESTIVTTAQVHGKTRHSSETSDPVIMHPAKKEHGVRVRCGQHPTKTANTTQTTEPAFSESVVVFRDTES